MKSEREIREELERTEERFNHYLENNFENDMTAHLAGEVAILRWVLEDDES